MNIKKLRKQVGATSSATLDNKHLLMIEPDGIDNEHPEDSLTRKIRGIYERTSHKRDIRSNFPWKMSRLLKEYRGTHECICGERSDEYDHVLPNGIITNSLAEHYITWHRSEIPQSELDKIEKLAKELNIP